MSQALMIKLQGLATCKALFKVSKLSWVPLIIAILMAVPPI